MPIIFMKKNLHPHKKKIISLITPSSKSIAIRCVAIAMAGLKFNPEINQFVLNNFPTCDDTFAALNVAKSLGFTAENITSNTILLTYNKQTSLMNNVEVNCGESALCYRLFSYFSKLFSSDAILTTSGSLTKRIKNDNSIPTGRLCSGEYKVDCSDTSQYLTGLLYSLPFIDGNSTIKINNPVSRGYIEMSIDLIRKVGINVDFEKDTININGNQKINCNNFLIEGDWSVASNFFVLGAISGEVQVANIDYKSVQPDAVILRLFESLKINFLRIADNIFSINKSRYQGFEFDATDCPDIIPPLVVLAFNAITPSKIIGINRLVNKESNRKDVLFKVFSMLGGRIRIENNCFVINPSALTGGFADSHSDHRIAMAIAIASNICKNPLTITGAECVNKSFPDFWKYIN